MHTRDLKGLEFGQKLGLQEAVQQARPACSVHFQQEGARARQCSRLHQPAGLGEGGEREV